jgi:hypothetical protein
LAARVWVHDPVHSQTWSSGPRDHPARIALHPCDRRFHPSSWKLVEPKLTLTVTRAAGAVAEQS